MYSSIPTDSSQEAGEMQGEITLEVDQAGDEALMFFLISSSIATIRDWILG